MLGLTELTSRLVAASSCNPPEDERAVADIVAAACRELSLPAPLVGCALDAIEAITGMRPPIETFPATTDAIWLQSVLGIAVLPACGPGLLSEAHTANEAVTVVALEQALAIYRDLILGFCDTCEEHPSGRDL